MAAQSLFVGDKRFASRALDAAAQGDRVNDPSSKKAPNRARPKISICENVANPTFIAPSRGGIV